MSGLRRNLAMVMVALVVASSVTVAWECTRRLDAAVTPSTFRLLEAETASLAASLEASVQGVRQDVKAFAGLDQVVRASSGASSDHDRTIARQQAAQVFMVILASKPTYLQIRLIEGGDDGREIVRVEREFAGAPPETVPAFALQRKGHRDYVAQVTATKPGTVYISALELNREHGVVEVPSKPVLRASTPVPSSGSVSPAPSVVLVINVDMRPALENLRASGGSGLYLVDSERRILLHPDHQFDFGFEQGRGRHLSDDLPGLDLLPNTESSYSMGLRSSTGDRLIAAIDTVQMSGGPSYYLVRVIGHEALAASLRSVRRASMRATAWISAAAVLIAGLFARALTKPLADLTEAVAGFTGSEELDLPTRGHGEVSVLTQAFRRMAQEVRTKTAALQAELATRDRIQELFRLAVVAAPNAMIAVDHAGSVVLANRQAEALFGYDADEATMIGTPVDDLVPVEARARHSLLRDSFFVDPTNRPMGAGRDLLAIRRDGTEFPVEIGLSPLVLDNEPIVLSTIVDLSERMAEERIRAEAMSELEVVVAERTAELRRSNEDLEMFAYVASHDLQEPLRMVASFTELLAEEYGETFDPEGRDYLHFIVDGARRMQRLLNDLLEYSRVGSRPGNFGHIDTGNALQASLDNLRLAIEASGAEITHEKMPMAWADAGQLTQLFQNLIGNAIKFAGEGTPKIYVGVCEEANDLRIYVKDDGIGFHMKYADRIFSAFQQLHSRSEYSGSGIGLAICKRIVQRLNGEISARSHPGAGTTFTFSIPRFDPKEYSDGDRKHPAGRRQPW